MDVGGRCRAAEMWMQRRRDCRRGRCESQTLLVVVVVVGRRGSRQRVARHPLGGQGWERKGSRGVGRIGEWWDGGRSDEGLAGREGKDGRRGHV